MGAVLRIQRPIQLQIQDAPWFGLALFLVERHDSQRKMFTVVYGTPSHVSDFVDLLWKTGFAQRRSHALSNELCFPFLKWATSIKRTLDVHSWKEPEEAIEMAAEDRQWLLRFTAILWFQLLFNTDVEIDGWWWWQLSFHEVCLDASFAGSGVWRATF